MPTKKFDETQINYMKRIKKKFSSDRGDSILDVALNSETGKVAIKVPYF